MQVSRKVPGNFEGEAVDSEAREFLRQRRKFGAGGCFSAHGWGIDNGSPFAGFLLLARALVLLGVGQGGGLAGGRRDLGQCKQWDS